MMQFRLSLFLIGLTAGFITADENEICWSRLPSSDLDPAVKREESAACPFDLATFLFAPGVARPVVLTSIDETPFQTFLISFQHGHKLVGEVILDAERDMTVMRRCANTSAGHADKEDKVWVSFQWRAPDDLDITDEVIIRYSVGTSDSYWVDCNGGIVLTSESLDLNTHIDDGNDNGDLVLVTDLPLSTDTVTPNRTPSLSSTPATQTPATQSPTTQRPATQSPVTQSPATQSPATQSPATQSPATQSPATQTPTTQSPATQRPATQSPATQRPATQSPATQSPATQSPATQSPATQSPATQSPATQSPATQSPATQRPVTQRPGTQSSSSQKPRVTAPVDIANGRGGSPRPTVKPFSSPPDSSNLKRRIINDSTCMEAGNRYEIIAGTDCRRFVQMWGSGRAEMTCPGSTRFSVTSCTCRNTDVCEH